MSENKDTVTVRMLADDRGSRDGRVVSFFHKGETHELPRSLAECFLNKKTAVLVKMRQAPQNKMLKGAAENK